MLDFVIFLLIFLVKGVIFFGGEMHVADARSKSMGNGFQVTKY